MYAREPFELGYSAAGSPDRISLWVDDTRTRDIDGSGTVEIATDALEEGVHLVGVSARRASQEVSAAIQVVVDRTAPFPDARTPADVEYQAPNSSPAEVHFSEPILFDGGTLGGGQLQFWVGAVGVGSVQRQGTFSVAPDGRSIRFTPDGGWVGRFPFQARSVGITWALPVKITDLAGNPLVPFAWQFTIPPWIRQGPTAKGVEIDAPPLAVWTGGVAIGRQPDSFHNQVLTLDAGTWVPLGEIDTTAGGSAVYGEAPALASTGSDLLAAAVSSYGVTVARWTGTAWDPIAPRLIWGSRPTMVVAPDGTPSIAYRSTDYATVRVHAVDAGTWTDLGPSLPVLSEWRLPVSYVIDRQGRRWLALPEWVEPGPALVLRLWSGSSWLAVGDPIRAPATFESPGLWIEADGAPWLAFRLQGTSAIRVVRLVNGAWEQVGADMVPAPEDGTVDSRPAIGPLPPDGGPFVAFHAVKDLYRKLQICIWSGSAWDCDAQLDFPWFTYNGGGVSLATGPGGPFIADWESGIADGVVVRAPNR